jgi:hypothetical protein
MDLRERARLLRLGLRAEAAFEALPAFAVGAAWEIDDVAPRLASARRSLEDPTVHPPLHLPSP